jgi:F0F1-type ATP synthase membrane subunit b/b'
VNHHTMSPLTGNDAPGQPWPAAPDGAVLELNRPAFGPAAFRERGLAPGQVYGWVDAALAELADSRSRTKVLTAENTRLREWAADRAAHVLRIAQDNAERLTADAEAEAGQMVADARAQYSETVAHARAQAEQEVGSARAQSDQIITEALSAAERAAADIRGQAPLDARAQVAYFTTVAAAIRAGLTANLEKLLAEVAAWQAAAAGEMPGAPDIAPGPAAAPARR